VIIGPPISGDIDVTHSRGYAVAGDPARFVAGSCRPAAADVRAGTFRVVTANQTTVELLQRHVLWPNEEIVRVRNWPDGVAVATQHRHFAAGSECADWLVGRAEWVDDMIVAVRDDIVVHGQPERFGFLICRDGRTLYVNDPATLAALGQRVPDQLDAVAYAELVVQFHHYTSALQRLLVHPDDLQKRYMRTDLPEAEPFRTVTETDGMRLTFISCAQYRRPLLGSLLDVSEWTVTIPTDQPARWEFRPVATAIPLDPPDSIRGSTQAENP
jgi:hypothetical protein